MHSSIAKKSLEDLRQGFRPAKTLFGQISFINALPLALPLREATINSACKFLFGTPQELNNMFASGKLDLGAMSSYFFLQSGDFELFPHVSISGTGRVGSVLLFSKVELNKLQGEFIEVPESSASSIKLLQILLKEEYGIDAELLYSSATSINPRSAATLLIGDQALKEDSSLSQTHLRVDLAQWWFKRYGLPFVFGVWAARKAWLANNRLEFDCLTETLLSAYQRGLGELFNQVLDEASATTGLDRDRLACYYRNELDYTFKEEHLQALGLFQKLCIQHGFISN